MKYLSIFANEAAYDAAKLEGLDLPHVSLVEATMEVKFDPYVVVPVNEPAEEPVDNGDDQNGDFNPENPSEPIAQE